MENPTIILILLCAFVLFAMPNTTHAYIDPGTAGMLTQILIGIIAASFFALRHYAVRIFRRIFPTKNLPEEKRKSEEIQKPEN